VLIIGIALTFTGIGDEAYWYDESFSAAVATRSVPDIVEVISKDSHPPLYYLMLRAFVAAFGDSVAAVRSLSALGTLALAALGFIYLRKEWGEIGGLAFSAIVLATPMSICAGQEARMYSWLTCFVTAMVLQGAVALRGDRLRSWVALSALTLAAAYTHYYGLVAAGFLLAHPFCRLAIRGEWSRLKKASIVGVITIAMYVPWVVFFVSQFSRVATHFWIDRLTVASVGAALVYPFTQKFLPVGREIAIALYFVTFTCAVAGAAISAKKGEERSFTAISAVAVYALTLGLAIIVSATVRPILVERYMLSCMGLLLLGFISFVTRFKKNALTLAVVVLFAAVNAPAIHRVHTIRVNGPMNEVFGLLKSSVRDDDVFVHGCEHNLGTFSRYFPRNRHYLYVPADYVPNGNYAAFAPMGEFGPDYMRFNEERVTIWATNMMGWVYSVPFGEIAGAPHRKAVGKPMLSRRRRAGMRSRCSASITTLEKSPFVRRRHRSTATMTVRLTGIDASRGGSILYSVFSSNPISPENALYNGSVPADSAAVSFSVKDVPVGPCAVLAFHDENDNQRPDFDSVGMIEGITFLRDISGLGRRPEFEDISFQFTEAASNVSGEMRYER
jgi:uncharacterized protein (DUF2141 family)